MTLARKHQQLPGRLEALRIVLRGGVNNATPLMLHIAGMNKSPRQCQPAPLHGVATFSSGIALLSHKERAELPF